MPNYSDYGPFHGRSLESRTEFDKQVKEHVNKLKRLLFQKEDNRLAKGKFRASWEEIDLGIGILIIASDLSKRTSDNGEYFKLCWETSSEEIRTEYRKFLIRGHRHSWWRRIFRA